MSRAEDQAPHPAAKARQAGAIKRAVGGWVLGLGGLVYAFQFEAPVGFVACAVGFGLLTIDNALKAIGK